MLIQLLQERTNQQQGNSNHGGNQFATLSQFLANQPKTFTSCDQPFDTEDWIRDMNKHFECSNVRPEDFVKFVGQGAGSSLVAAVEGLQGWQIDQLG